MKPPVLTSSSRPSQLHAPLSRAFLVDLGSHCRAPADTAPAPAPLCPVETCSAPAPCLWLQSFQVSTRGVCEQRQLWLVTLGVVSAVGATGSGTWEVPSVPLCLPFCLLAMVKLFLLVTFSSLTRTNIQYRLPFSCVFSFCKVGSKNTRRGVGNAACQRCPLPKNMSNRTGQNRPKGARSSPCAQEFAKGAQGDDWFAGFSLCSRPSSWAPSVHALGRWRHVETHLNPAARGGPAKWGPRLATKASEGHLWHWGCSSRLAEGGPGGFVLGFRPTRACPDTQSAHRSRRPSVTLSIGEFELKGRAAQRTNLGLRMGLDLWWDSAACRGTLHREGVGWRHVVVLL